MRETPPVLIAGGGPAGAATALLLARAGIGVTILERAQFPRVKVCGEYLNAGAVGLLGAFGLHDVLRSHASPVPGIRLYGSGTHAEFRFRTPGWSLPRSVLDEALLQAAVGAGASLVRGRVEGVRVRDRGVSAVVREPSGDLVEIEGILLAGADGAQSAVARACGLDAQPRGPSRFALGGHYAGIGDSDGWVEMFVDGRSYFAVNPLGGEFANVMLIVTEADLERRRDDVDSFVRERARALSGSARFDDARLDGKRVAIGPLAHRTRAQTAPHVLLVGDAAQFVDPFTGQGVYLALRGATFASAAIESVVRGGVPEDRAWRVYERRLQAEVRDRARIAALVGWFVRVPPLARRAAAKLARDPQRAAPIVDAVAGIAPAASALRLRHVLRLVA